MKILYDVFPHHSPTEFLAITILSIILSLGPNYFLLLNSIFVTRLLLLYLLEEVVSLLDNEKNNDERIPLIP